MRVASVKRKTNTVALMYSGLFATLMMIGANITAFVPFLMIGGVPITLQTFFATLAGLVLGRKQGAMACAVYMLVGLAGAPVFAKFMGGFAIVLSPTFGFIVAFIVSAYVAGAIVEKGQTKRAYIVAAFAALLINYVLGTTWLYGAYTVLANAPEGFSYGMAWLWMLAPLAKDSALIVFAALFAYRLQKVLKILPIRA